MEDDLLIAERKAAQAFAEANVIECVQELLEWHDTAILCDGKVRELATLCLFAGHSALKVAENMVNRAALERLIKEIS